MSFKISSIDSTQQSQELSYWGGFTSGVQNLVKKVCSAVGSPFVELYNLIRPVNPVTGYREIRFIPTAAEIAMGLQIYSAACESEGGILDDEKMQKRVKDVLAKIVPHAQRPGREFEYEIRVLNSDEVNAWAAPGGKLGFNKGLIDEIDKMDLSEWEGLTPDDVLASVEGHEAAHAAIGHTRRKLEKSYLFQIAFFAAAVAYYTLSQNKKTTEENPATTESEPKRISWEEWKDRQKIRRKKREEKQNSSTFYAALGYCAYQLYKLMGSRSDEYEADLYGTRLSFEAGYDVRGSLALQKLFIKVHGGDGENPSALEWISTHPDPVNRLKENQKTVDAIFKEHGCYKKVEG